MPSRTAYEFMLFYICFNLATWMLAEMSASGWFGIKSPFGTYITSFGFNITGFLTNPASLLATGAMTLIGIMGVLTGRNILGFGFITLAILSVFAAPIGLIVSGLPLLVSTVINSLGMGAVATIIYVPILAVNSFVWAVFLLEFVGQRDIVT